MFTYFYVWLYLGLDIAPCSVTSQIIGWAPIFYYKQELSVLPVTHPASITHLFNFKYSFILFKKTVVNVNDIQM